MKKRILPHSNPPRKFGSSLCTKPEHWNNPNSLSLYITFQAPHEEFLIPALLLVPEKDEMGRTPYHIQFRPNRLPTSTCCKKLLSGHLENILTWFALHTYRSFSNINSKG